MKEFLTQKSQGLLSESLHVNIATVHIWACGNINWTILVV